MRLRRLLKTRVNRVQVTRQRWIVWVGILVLLGSIMEGVEAQRLMNPGVDVPGSVRAELEPRLASLGKVISLLQQGSDPHVIDLLPDVEIFHKAVSVALRHDEFIHTNEFKIADELLTLGMERAAALRAGSSPWTEETGLVVRGYRSRIDDSVQPYGLVIPKGGAAFSAPKIRNDVWLHGRDNRLTELKFINQRMSSEGRFSPPDTLVLHPYGRFCNAFKFAGEVDVFEALDAVKKHYSVDEDRIAIRGFSMGGAGCWHLAVHYPDVWVAAAPGAGFAESAEYLGLWRKVIKPTWYQQRLWHCYDATDYALNLFHNPTVAYSGEVDKQIQAAQIMSAALEREGMRLRHVIGPVTGHTYHPRAKQEVASRVDAIVRRGKERVPRRLKFTTWTLRYSKSHWIELLGLERHWERARVEAEVRENNEITVQVENVSHFEIRFGAGDCPIGSGLKPQLIVNGERLMGSPVMSDRSWSLRIGNVEGEWRQIEEEGLGLRKKPGLQGPIDDAFMDRFVIVEPSGPIGSTPAANWIKQELERLKREWRAQFRGEPLVVQADDLTKEHLRDCHLILWGDAGNQPLLREMGDRLPLRWMGKTLALGEGTWDSDVVVPMFIYPNPLNPERYVVVNSGFTFRGFGSNATQVPMLPDYALVDVRQPATALSPGEVVVAGFFDEQWKLEGR